MKLSHIVPSLEEQHGGPSKSVRALCGALARGGDDVELLTTHPLAPVGGEPGSDGTLRITTFRREWPRQICRSRGLRRHVGNSQADVWHHHALWLRTLHYAQQRAAATGTRLVVSPRGMMSDWAWQHRRWRKTLARAVIHPGAFNAVDGWHATSAEEERDIRARGFLQPVCVAPNGVDAPTADTCAAAAAHWRAVCPAVAERRVALFYSRFHRKKRVLELIDTWLAAAPRDWLLLLVGLPQDYTATDLERHAAQQSGSGRVAAFSGAGQPAPYPVASLFVLPSHNENFGLVIAEAMAHGVPALVTDTTPWTELNRSQLGWCVPWADYASALRAATREPAAQLAQRGAAARSWVVREFSWASSARKLADFYAALGPAKA